MKPEKIDYSREGVRVLHVLAKSIPVLNGYSIRGHELIRSQERSGLVKPLALTSPFYPADDSMSIEATFDGIRYLRSMPIMEAAIGPLRMKILGKSGIGIGTGKSVTRRKSQSITENRNILSQITLALSYPFRLAFSFIDEKIRIEYFRGIILETIRDYEPDIVHAHTPFKVGLPAMQAAIATNKSFVYEVRGLWEESAIARGKLSRFGVRYWRFKRMEIKVMKGADAIFCISEGVKNELIRRGVNGEKITVIHNAAPKDFLSFSVEDEDEIIDEEMIALTSELKEIRRSKKIIGYVGNIQRYEGIETLVDSVSKMLSEGQKIHLAIISNEEDTSGVSSYCEESGIGGHCTIIGPVARKVIPHIYGYLDINVIPRLVQSKMGQLVTPLKPLDALSLGIPLIISDSPAIREIVSEDRGTFFDSGNSADLKEKIEFILSNEELRTRKVENGRKWVSANATWDHRARMIMEEYEKIL